jgi:lysophospholipase L1-like esterase
MRSLRARLVILVVALCVLASHGAADAQPSLTKWYLAEGATGPFFEEEILIGNPNASAATISITYLQPEGVAPIVQTFTIQPTSRKTVRVNDVPGLANVSAVSAVVECTNGLDIVVERSMYWASQSRRGGHNSPGVLAPAKKWLLAEGSTGFFDTFVLIANPDTTNDATVDVTFLKPDGTTVKVQRTVKANARLNVWVNAEVPELAGKAFSTVVESVNGTPVFVERAMYFGGNPWEGGHESAGLTEPSTSWFFAEGYTGGSPSLSFDTFLLLANPGAQSANVTVTFLLEGAAPIVRTYTLLPTSRENVWVDLLPGLENIAFSAQVESDQPIMVERAEYWGATGLWIDAHDTPGLTTDALKWAFADGAEDGLRLSTNGATSVQYDSYFLVANPADAALALRATFTREDGTGIVRTYTVPAKSRFTIPTSLYPELSNQRFSAFLESTNDVKFAAERAMYWGVGYYGGHASTGTPWTGTIGTPAAPPAPLITKVDPTTGLVTGGTPFVIEGTNFRHGSSVTFGGAPAAGVQVLTSTVITGITPAHAPGAVDVVVNAGTTTTSLAAAFTYVAPPPTPVITSVTPGSGPTTGGTQVVIAGTGFTVTVDEPGGGTALVTLVTDVAIGGASVPFVLETAASLKVTTPAHASGPVAVSVTTPYGTATLAEGFTYFKRSATDNTLAFGDSITYGISSTLLVDGNGTYQKVTTTVAAPYPSLLRTRLNAEYAPQEFAVANAGVSGECASLNCTDVAGVVRLPTTLSAAQDLVIILEGVNDLNAGATQDRIVRNLRTMVRSAKGAGKAVMLGTLTPVKEGEDLVKNGCSGALCWRADPVAIASLNGRLRSLAVEESVVLVDFERAFNLSPDYRALLSPDGLHPNESGYSVMAQKALEIIQANFEAVPPIVP